MDAVMRAVTDWPAPLVHPRMRIRRGSLTGSLARFLSCASWSRAPGPVVAPLPVMILTLPPQEAFMSRAGPLSARSIDGSLTSATWWTAGTGTGAGAATGAGTGAEAGAGVHSGAGSAAWVHSGAGAGAAAAVHPGAGGAGTALARGAASARGAAFATGS